MFSDGKIAEKFELSRSASYMIAYDMGPYFQETIVEKIIASKLPFYLHFDETSTSQKKKQVDFVVQIWTVTHDEVWICYFTSQTRNI